MSHTNIYSQTSSHLEITKQLFQFFQRFKCKAQPRIPTKNKLQYLLREDLSSERLQNVNESLYPNAVEEVEV